MNVMMITMKYKLGINTTVVSTLVVVRKNE